MEMFLMLKALIPWYKLLNYPFMEIFTPTEDIDPQYRKMYISSVEGTVFTLR